MIDFKSKMMDLRVALLQEHSKAQRDRIADWVGERADRFALLTDVFLHSEYRIVQRAAWVMAECVSRHPELIKPHFQRVMTMLEKPEAHDAVRRNILRILQEVDIPKTHHGFIMEKCFAYIASNDVPVAIKAFSLTILDRLAASYPDIRHELKLLIEERLPHETAAFRSRAKKIIMK